MKKLKIVVLAGVLAAMCIGLTACFWPVDIPDVPDVPDARQVAPTAVFSYYPVTYPVQTDSQVLFDGSESNDPDGEIIWAEWNFGDGTGVVPDSVIEGPWTKVVSDWENGVEILKIVSVKREVRFTYKDILDPEDGDFCYYTVTLTIWDNDGNSSATSRQIKVTNK